MVYCREHSLCFGENLSAVLRPSVGQQTADSRPTDGRQTADSRPTVGRQVFWGALLHNYRKNYAQAKILGQSICFCQSCCLSGRQLIFCRGDHSSNANKDTSSTGTTLILSLLMMSISCFPNKNTTQQAWQD